MRLAISTLPLTSQEVIVGFVGVIVGVGDGVGVGVGVLVGVGVIVGVGVLVGVGVAVGSVQQQPYRHEATHLPPA
jgi:hypothetical protein